MTELSWARGSQTQHPRKQMLCSLREQNTCGNAKICGNADLTVFQEKLEFLMFMKNFLIFKTLVSLNKAIL